MTSFLSVYVEEFMLIRLKPTCMYIVTALALLQSYFKGIIYQENAQVTQCSIIDQGNNPYDFSIE